MTAPLFPRAHLFEFNDRDWVPASLRARNAVDSRAPIFVSECFERDPRGALPAAWTWRTPIGLAAGTRDAIISTLRIYSEQDLRDLVAPFGQGYEWTYGTYDYPFGGRGCYFQGLPCL